MEIGTREQDAGLVRRQGDQLHPPTGRFRDDRLVDGQSAVEAGPDHQPAARPGDGLQEAERRVPVAVAERPRRLLLAPIHAPPLDDDVVVVPLPVDLDQAELDEAYLHRAPSRLRGGVRTLPRGRPALDRRRTDGSIEASRAGVTQLAECLLPKQNVAGSNPVSRSTSSFVLSATLCLRAHQVQGVVATLSCPAKRSTSSRTSAGVLGGRVLRGRGVASRSTGVCRARSVPLGKYWRSSPLVFSLVPRCHGLRGSAKKTGMPVSTLNAACAERSFP